MRPEDLTARIDEFPNNFPFRRHLNDPAPQEFGDQRIPVGQAIRAGAVVAEEQIGNAQPLNVSIEVIALVIEAPDNFEGRRIDFDHAGM